MPSKPWRQDVVARARRVVVKIGTSSLTDARGRLDVPYLRDLAGQVAGVVSGGVAVTLVASGAVGAGMAELDLPRRPATLPLLQATAAVGQGQLMRHFAEAFAAHGVKVAQILVTRGDFESRTRYLNIRNTVVALEEFGVVPILNENDTVAVEELRVGDNDIIAAHMTNLLAAGVLVLLTSVDGVYRGKELLDVIEDVNHGAEALPTGARSALGSGGMGTKLTAARMVAAAGEVTIVANARAPRVLPRLLAGEKLGTLCVPSLRRMSARRRWIGQAARAAGRITIDDGAVAALRKGGRSLLPSGVTAVAGAFRKGDTVAVVDRAGAVIARGLTNYSAEQADAIKGLKTSQIARILGEKPYDELIHRNNMTLL